MKKLFLFVLFLLSLFALSCNNNVLKPSDYSKEEINKKYPYWQVGVSRFEINENVGKRTSITITEKRFILRCMALMRLAVNTTEFADGVYAKKSELISGENDSYGGYTLKPGDPYDPQRIIDIIRSLKYDFVYKKMNTGAGTGWVGSSRYLRYGLQPDSEIPIGDWVGFVNADWVSWSRITDPVNDLSNSGYATTTGLMFHEHMHNIGFLDPNTYALDGIVGNIVTRVISGDLKDKYAKELDELTAYYYTEYKDLLLEDSVFDPSKK